MTDSMQSESVLLAVSTERERDAARARVFLHARTYGLDPEAVDMLLDMLDLA